MRPIPLSIVLLTITTVAIAQRTPPRDNPQQYSLQQAISDQAQLHTIAFYGLAFLTGDFGFDTFLPPGKDSDYFGFQCIQDST